MGRPAARDSLSGEDWRRIGDLADRLEGAWLRDGTAGIGPLLPPSGDPLRAAALRELVKTDLEIRCRRGAPAALEPYLREFPELAAAPDDVLADLLFEEYRVRNRYGDRPALGSYQDRFPRLFDALHRLVRDDLAPAAGGPASTPVAPPAQASMAPMESNYLPPIAGGYVPESLIGRGGFGEVWRARAPGGVLVAVKIIRRPADHEERIREERALQVVKQLHHHFLAKTHQYHSDKESLFIVMELADCSLRDRLRETRKAGLEGMPIEELAPLFREAAEALDYLHAKGVLHRDIKPDNILLLEGHVRLADFGLAKLQEQKMMSVSGSGTYAYMAPEVWGGKATAQSDQYSLAYSYAELRLGRRPFHHTDFASLMLDHMQHAPDLGAMPEPERRVVMQALAKLPEERFPTCVDFARALHRLVDNVPDTSAQRPAASAPAARRTQRAGPAPVVTGKGWTPSESDAPSDAEEPVTRPVESLLPDRTPRSETGSVTAARAQTAPSPLKPRGRRRPWAGFISFVAVVAVAAAGFVGWLAFSPGPGPTREPTATPPASTSPHTTPPPTTAPHDGGWTPDDFISVGVASDGLYPGLATERQGVRAEFVLLRRRPDVPDDPTPFYMMKTKATNALVAALSGGARPAPAEAQLPAFRLPANQARQLAVLLGGQLPTTAQYDRAVHYSGQRLPLPLHAAVGRIDQGPMAVNDPADDDETPDPERVRDLFGNGTELTRNLVDGRTGPDDLVILRGWTFASPRVMTYDDLEYQHKTPQVQYEHAASPYTGFRVVIEPPAH